MHVLCGAGGGGGSAGSRFKILLSFLRPPRVCVCFTAARRLPCPFAGASGAGSLATSRGTARRAGGAAAALRGGALRPATDVGRSAGHTVRRPALSPLLPSSWLLPLPLLPPRLLLLPPRLLLRLIAAAVLFDQQCVEDISKDCKAAIRGPRSGGDRSRPQSAPGQFLGTFSFRDQQRGG